jgi:hypothetical protein
MIDPTYGVQALAWAVVWGTAGLTGREYLARKESERTQSHLPAKRVPAGKSGQ